VHGHLKGGGGGGGGGGTTVYSSSEWSLLETGNKAIWISVRVSAASSAIWLGGVDSPAEWGKHTCRNHALEAALLVNPWPEHVLRLWPLLLEGEKHKHHGHPSCHWYQHTPPRCRDTCTDTGMGEVGAVKCLIEEMDLDQWVLDYLSWNSLRSYTCYVQTDRKVFFNTHGQSLNMLASVWGGYWIWSPVLILRLIIIIPSFWRCMCSVVRVCENYHNFWWYWRYNLHTHKLLLIHKQLVSRPHWCIIWDAGTTWETELSLTGVQAWEWYGRFQYCLKLMLRILWPCGKKMLCVELRRKLGGASWKVGWSFNGNGMEYATEWNGIQSV